jgi:hypothetical protein
VAEGKRKRKGAENLARQSRNQNIFTEENEGNKDREKLCQKCRQEEDWELWIQRISQKGDGEAFYKRERRKRRLDRIPEGKRMGNEVLGRGGGGNWLPEDVKVENWSGNDPTNCQDSPENRDVSGPMELESQVIE